MTKVVVRLMILTRGQPNFESAMLSGDLGPGSKISTYVQGCIAPWYNKTISSDSARSCQTWVLSCFSVCLSIFVLFWGGFFCKTQMLVGSRSQFLLSELM